MRPGRKRIVWHRALWRGSGRPRRFGSPGGLSRRRLRREARRGKKGRRKRKGEDQPFQAPQVLTQSGRPSRRPSTGPDSSEFHGHRSAPAARRCHNPGPSVHRGPNPKRSGGGNPKPPSRPAPPAPAPFSPSPPTAPRSPSAAFPPCEPVAFPPLPCPALPRLSLRPRRRLAPPPGTSPIHLQSSGSGWGSEVLSLLIFYLGTGGKRIARGDPLRRSSRRRIVKKRNKRPAPTPVLHR